jgi:hypothetical protein
VAGPRALAVSLLAHAALLAAIARWLDGRALDARARDGAADRDADRDAISIVGDPYASRKLKLLDDTRAERVESGGAYRAAQLERSAQLMARNLEALWRATADPAARREVLFELWDECAEGEGPAGAAGARARAMVIGWIGTHLPKGQPGAFSDEDIARLDARRSSKQHFAPY